jgi:hypothetical protein
LPFREAKRQKKKYLTINDARIPKNALAALEKMVEIDSIMSEAKNVDALKSDTSKLLKTKLSYIADETLRTNIVDALRAFITELNQHILNAFIN